MSRKKAHSEGKEALLENLLSSLRFKKIIRHIPSGSHVLDLGCGYNASFAREVLKKESACIGVDISVSKTPQPDGITLIEHDLSDRLPFGDNTFDVVTSLANLEHLQKPEEVLKEALRVLKPGGILLLTTPSIYAKPVLEFLSYKLHIVSESEIRDHKTYFYKKLLKTMLQEAGFRSSMHRYFQVFMNNFVKAVK